MCGLSMNKRFLNTNVLSFVKKQLPTSPILPIKELKNQKPPVNVHKNLIIISSS
jgi:hypothetical protein